MGNPIVHYAICWNNLLSQYITSTNYFNDINIILYISIFVFILVNYSYFSQNDIIWILSASNQRSSSYDNIYSFNIDSNLDYHCNSSSDNTNSYSYFINGDKFNNNNNGLKKIRSPSIYEKVGNNNNDFIIPYIYNNNNNYTNNNINHFFYQYSNPINIRNDFSVGTPETISIAMNKKIISFFHEDTGFDQWLAGVIDASGKIGITKKNNVYIEIVTLIEDIKILRYIQSNIGGNIKFLTDQNMVQYRMQKDAGIVDISNRIKNFLQNYERIQQFQLILPKYGIQRDKYIPLTIDSKWFVGYFDAKGFVISIIDNPIIKDLSIQIVSDNFSDVNLFYQIFGGKIEEIQSSNYKWFTINKDQNMLFYNYYIKNIRQFQTNKSIRLYLISEFYKVKPKNPFFKNTYVSKSNSWENFNLKWKAYYHSIIDKYNHLIYL